MSGIIALLTSRTVILALITCGIQIANAGGKAIDPAMANTWADYALQGVGMITAIGTGVSHIMHVVQQVKVLPSDPTQQGRKGL